jgi:mono/diheme cytochrome c family protein
MASDDIVKTIAEGHGKMYSYADRVAERDRWAIAAYIRTLQAEHRR